MIAAYPDHLGTPAFGDALAAADRACMPREVIAAGLFEGRGSMLLHLAGQVRRRRADATRADLAVDCGSLLDRHLRDLSWQVTGLRGHYTVPGRRLLRLSTDLATGAAGLLLAVHEAVRGPVPLPGITDFPGVTDFPETTDFPGHPDRGQHTHRKDHHHDEHPLPAAAGR
ncbi:hypothetical protein GXW82_16510 [Streptacidiphilus sp. 4-A2]|nr:hypothetical protein [Streptacidiphilus sp. 4-A2]